MRYVEKRLMCLLSVARMNAHRNGLFFGARSNTPYAQEVREHLENAENMMALGLWGTGLMFLKRVSHLIY